MNKKLYLILASAAVLAAYFAKPFAPPGYEVVGVTLAIASSVVLSVLMFFRLRIGVELSRTVVLSLSLSIGALGAYIAVYSNTVFNVHGQKVLLPFVSTPTLREMYNRAGGREEALERYGYVALAEASRGPNLRLTATLLILMFSTTVAICSVSLSLMLFSLLRNNSSKRYRVTISDSHGHESSVKVSLDDQESIGSFIDKFK